MGFRRVPHPLAGETDKRQGDFAGSRIKFNLDGLGLAWLGWAGGCDVYVDSVVQRLQRLENTQQTVITRCFDKCDSVTMMIIATNEELKLDYRTRSN